MLLFKALSAADFAVISTTTSTGDAAGSSDNLTTFNASGYKIGDMVVGVSLLPNADIAGGAFADISVAIRIDGSDVTEANKILGGTRSTSIFRVAAMSRYVVSNNPATVGVKTQINTYQPEIYDYTNALIHVPSSLCSTPEDTDTAGVTGVASAQVTLSTSADSTIILAAISQDSSVSISSDLTATASFSGAIGDSSTGGYGLIVVGEEEGTGGSKTITVTRDSGTGWISICAYSLPKA